MSKLIRISDHAHDRLVELSGTSKFSISFLGTLAIDQMYNKGIDIALVRTKLDKQVDEAIEKIAPTTVVPSSPMDDDEIEDLYQSIGKQPPPVKHGGSSDLINMLGGDGGDNESDQ